MIFHFRNYRGDADTLPKISLIDDFCLLAKFRRAREFSRRTFRLESSPYGVGRAD